MIKFQCYRIQKLLRKEPTAEADYARALPSWRGAVGKSARTPDALGDLAGRPHRSEGGFTRAIEEDHIKPVHAPTKLVVELYAESLP